MAYNSDLYTTVKSFPSLSDAERFVAGENPSLCSGTGLSAAAKYYAVKNGRVPGIYSDWSSAQEQITGWQKPKHRCFSTRMEAQKFLDGDTSKSDESPTTPQAESSSFSASNDAEGLLDSTVQPPAQKSTKRLVNGGHKAKQQVQEYNEDDYEPGTGPLPPGAEDGFDPNIMLDPESGEIVYKTQEQRQATKPAPAGDSQTGPIRIHTDGSSIGNGTVGAFAGIGVYFGPADKRYYLELRTFGRQWTLLTLA